MSTTTVPGDGVETIFDKFVQSRKIRTGGGRTEPGLAICKEIIEAYQGCIRAENIPDGGTTVTLIIPFQQAGS